MKIVILLCIAIFNIGCISYNPTSDIYPIYRDGILFWKRTNQNTVMSTVLVSDQKLGTPSKIDIDEIPQFLMNVCNKFPEFNTNIPTSISVIIGNNFSEINYASLSKDRLTYYDNSSFLSSQKIILQKGWCKK